MLGKMLALAGWAAVLWFTVHWAFIAVVHAKAVKERGMVSKYWLVILFPLVLIGLALDVAFNVTFGTLLYRELPRELLFTARCKRHFRGDGSRKRMADWWAKQLNQFDPGHID
jgi:hypothetical protein